jgi:membrane-associated phospholipid phosphatase
MVSNKSKSLKRMMAMAIPSAMLFIVMYFMTNDSSRTAFHNFMKSTFGILNRWSPQTYGPPWLYRICLDISALGGHIDFIIIVSFVSCFLFFLREEKKLNEFLFTIIGAVILLFIVKFTMNPNFPDNWLDVFFTDDFGFPSGHALSSLVLYTTLAKFSGKKLIYTKARYVIYVFVSILIFLIGVARLFTSHTATEVIAGWCAGIFWLSIVNYFFRKH